MDERTGTRRYSSLCFYLLDGAVSEATEKREVYGHSVMSSPENVEQTKADVSERLLVLLSILKTFLNACG